MSTLASANRRLAGRLAVVVLAMFGFGYLMVPLYNVFCEVTGLNGKTGRISTAAASGLGVDRSRTVTVEFVTSVNAGFPWSFRPLVNRVEVHPGEETQVMFEASNRGSEGSVGQAIPSVAPNGAARYFSKTECFCFTQQPLQAGETRQMPVRFVVDPKLPEGIDTLTLAYTFFRSTATVSATGAAGGLDPRS